MGVVIEQAFPASSRQHGQLTGALKWNLHKPIIGSGVPYNLVIYLSVETEVGGETAERDCL